MRRERCFALLLMMVLTLKSRAGRLLQGCWAAAEPETETEASSANVSLSRANGAIDAGYKYLIFPQGSNVQLIYCLTIGSYAPPQGLFTLGVTAGLAYELPYRHTVPYRKPAEVYHRRSRRDLYRKLEAMLNAQGKHGRGCVLKALCRAGKRNLEDRLLAIKASFLEEILHSVFTFPDLENDDDGDGDQELMRHYQEAYNAREDCDELFLYATSCPWLF